VACDLPLFKWEILRLIARPPSFLVPYNSQCGWYCWDQFLFFCCLWLKLQLTSIWDVTIMVVVWEFLQFNLGVGTSTSPPPPNSYAYSLAHSCPKWTLKKSSGMECAELCVNLLKVANTMFMQQFGIFIYCSFWGGGESQTGFTPWGGWVLWVAFIKALGFIHRNLTYLSVRRGCQKWKCLWLETWMIDLEQKGVWGQTDSWNIAVRHDLKWLSTSESPVDLFIIIIFGPYT